MQIANHQTTKINKSNMPNLITSPTFFCLISQSSTTSNNKRSYCVNDVGIQFKAP